MRSKNKSVGIRKKSLGRFLVLAGIYMLSTQLEDIRTLITRIMKRESTRRTVKSTNQFEKQSTIWCVGPSSDAALKSRIAHDPAERQPGTHSGKTTTRGGGWRQRSCLIRNACLESDKDDIIVHVKHDMDLGDVFLKVEKNVGLSAELFKLRTQKQWEDDHDDNHPATALVIRRGSIPMTAIWHGPEPLAYFQPFFPENFGHCVFDDIFAAYSAMRVVGALPASGDNFTLMPTFDCEINDLNCKRYLYEWGTLISSGVRPRSTLGSGLHCFDKIVVGSGMYSPMGVDLQNVGRAVLFREFHARMYSALGWQPESTLKQHRVLIMEKSGRRRVTNFHQIAATIQKRLGVETEFFPKDLHTQTPRRQLEIFQRSSIILTPVGGISMPTFFAPRGTAIIFISHVNWEDLFFNNLNHIIDLYYICDDSETLKHAHLDDHWNGADVAPRVEEVVEMVRRAMIQYEIFHGMFTK